MKIPSAAGKGEGRGREGRRKTEKTALCATGRK